MRQCGLLSSLAGDWSHFGLSFAAGTLQLLGHSLALQPQPMRQSLKQRVRRFEELGGSDTASSTTLKATGGVNLLLSLSVQVLRDKPCLSRCAGALQAGHPSRADPQVPLPSAACRRLAPSQSSMSEAHPAACCGSLSLNKNCA